MSAPRSERRSPWRSGPHRTAGGGLLLVALLVGCGGRGGGDGADGGLPPPVDARVDAQADAALDAPYTVTELTVTQNPQNPLSYYVTWTTAPALPTELLLDCGAPLRHRFPAGPSRTAHRVFVMGLYAGLSCEVTAHPDRPQGEGVRTATIAAAGPLPAGLPVLQVDTVDASRMEPGWTLFSVGTAGVAGEVTVVAIDPQGRYRWLYRPGVSYVSAEASIALVPEGLLLGNLRTDGQIVTWEGARLWQLGTANHHDLRSSPFHAGSVLFLSHRETLCPSSGTVEHSAVELERGTESVLWDWWVCDHWTPRLVYDGWSHLNAIEPVPGEEALLISSRNQDALFKVRRDTGELLWALGRDGDFAMDPADHFLRQHAPQVLDDGTILLFDNGLRAQEAANEGLAAREYSRVLQLALTFDGQGRPAAAASVWEYVDPAVFATSRGEADRLPGGNTLIHYTYVWPDRRVILREVDGAGETLWNVTTPPDVASYQSERVAEGYGYVLTD